MLRLSTWVQLPALKQHARAVAVAAGALLILVWWLATPAGLLGKADAVGYAVCHRIDLRSFHLGERPLPLCARCSGIYLGALVGLGAQAFRRRRAGRLPPRRLLVLLVAFIVAMGVDGANSFLTLFPGAPHLYEPSNSLRLVTGTLAGLSLAGLLYPTVNQTVWRAWEDRPGIAGFRELGGVLLLAGVVAAMVWSENPILLYPLALLSAVGVLVVLTMVDTVIVLIALGRENRAEAWRDVRLPAFLGLTLAMIQIVGVDALRYGLTGTWAGFSF